VTLAVVKSAFMVDHCVVILDVSNNQVTVADPVLGEITMSFEQFEKNWQFSGIVLSRNQKT
jgi:predicted double-glycine peptidase